MADRPVKLLVLFPLRLWETKLSPARRHAIWAMMRRKDLFRVVQSGPGWRGWVERETLATNAQRVMPDADAILTYKPLGTREALPLKEVLGCDVPRVLAFNECWWPGSLASKEAIEAGASLIVCHHANDMPHFDLAKSWIGCRVVHIPHGAERATFDLNEDGPRLTDVLLAGNCAPNVYPLRSKWAEVLGLLGRRVCVKLPHPGYRKRSSRECEETVGRYARHLNESKIALVCGSKHRYPLAKYVEAAMAGCLVLGDMPEQAPDGYDELVAQVPMDAPIEILAGVVNDWLDRPNDLRAFAKRSREVAREQFSQDRYAERFHAAVSEHLSKAGKA